MVWVILLLKNEITITAITIRTAGVDAAKIVMKDISWHIPHFTPSLENDSQTHDDAIIYLFQMLFVKQDRINIPLTELNVIMIERNTVKHVKKEKTSIG